MPQQYLLEPASIKQLRDRGLFISGVPVFRPDHVCYPNGYVVIKPTITLGNSLPGYEMMFHNNKGDECLSDAPRVILFRNFDKWKIVVHEYIPGPGPGDFEEQFDSQDRAVEAVKRYFFEPNSFFSAALRARHRAPKM